MRNIIIFVALLGAAAIFTVLNCLIAAGSQAEKKLTEIMRKEEESTAKKSHGPASTVTGGEAKRKAVT